MLSIDAHGGDNETELTEENITSEFLNLTWSQTEQTFCSSIHGFGLGGDTDGESAWHIHTDVLPTQGIGEVGIDADRGEGEIGVVLNDWPHEGSSAVDASSTGFVTGRSVDNENLVGRTTTVAINDGNK